MKQNPPSLAITFIAALAAGLAGFASVYFNAAWRGGEPVAETRGQPTGAPVQSSGTAPGGALADLAAAIPKLVLAANPAAPDPGVAFAAADGTRKTLAAWRGKVVVVNLWATWCAPCKVEMPSLDRLQQQLGSGRFEVVTISLDRTGPDLPKQFFETNNLNALDLYIDETGEAGPKLKAAGLPTSLVLDAQGREIARLAGTAEWDSPEAVAFLKAVISGAGA